MTAGYFLQLFLTGSIDNLFPDSNRGDRTYLQERQLSDWMAILYSMMSGKQPGPGKLDLNEDPVFREV